MKKATVKQYKSNSVLYLMAILKQTCKTKIYLAVIVKGRKVLGG